MKGTIVKDWNKIDFSKAEDQKKFRGALQHFFNVPQTDKEVRAALQHFATTGDFPANINQVIEKIHQTPDWDLGYEQVFNIRDFTGTNASGFDILDVQSGLAFQKVETGEKAKVYKMSGAKTSVSFDMYGGALGWDRKLFDDKQYWDIEDNAIEFRNKAFQDRAADFYALIEAVTGEDVTWQGVTADSEVDRDIKTIRQAAYTILNDVKNSGYGVNANTELKLLAPLFLKDRILRALSQLNQAFAGSSKALNYNITPVFTLMLSSNSYYYVCLPGRKMKGGYRMNLTLFADFDILAYADTVAGWQRYGGAIGDTNQVKKCAIA